MKARLVTFTKEKLNNSQRSILSKTLFGYTDRSNKGNYAYKREGLIDDFKSIKVANNTFIIENKGWVKVRDLLEKKGAKIKSWEIEISKF